MSKENLQDTLQNKNAYSGSAKYSMTQGGSTLNTTNDNFKSFILGSGATDK
jgi:hypothetical protein